MPSRIAHLLLFTILAATQFAATAAVAEPSFEETRDWIIGQVADYKRDLHVGGFFIIQRDVRNLRIGKCNLRFEVHGRFEQDGNERLWVWKDDLEIADIKSIEYVAAEAEPYLRISTYTNSVSFERAHSDKTTEDTGLDDNASLAGRFGKQPGLPDRLAKAFLHLAELARNNPDCPKRARPRTDLF